MPDSDLDYVHVVGRLVMSVGDSPADAGDKPDLISPDIGAEVWFIPQSPQVLAANASPPVTILNSTIVAPLAADGTITYNGVDGVWLVDLGSTKVNPRIPRDQGAYRVEFHNVMFDGKTINIPPFYCHPLPGEDNDISDMAPVPPGSPIPIVQGEKGDTGDTGPVGPIGPDPIVAWDGTAYPARPHAEPVIFVGDVNPDTLGLMLPGDTWIDTGDEAAEEVFYATRAEATVYSSTDPGYGALWIQDLGGGDMTWWVRS